MASSRPGSRSQVGRYPGGIAPTHTPLNLGQNESVLGHDTEVSAGGVGLGGKGGDRFLDQANAVEISKEDRQEGYDTDLLNLQPRTAQADAAAEAQALDSASPLVNTADGGQPKIASQVAYAARDPAAEKEKAARRKKRKSKKKKLSWWQRGTFVVFVGVAIVAVGLALGLGLGLGLKKNNNKSSNSGESSQSIPAVSSAGGPAVSESGSASTASSGVAANTQAAPVPSASGARSGLKRTIQRKREAWR